MSIKLSGSRGINQIIWLSILTSSFDIVLVFDIAGFTIRISQLLMIFVMLYFIVDVIRSGKIHLPVGYFWLCSCVIINTVFIFNSKSLINAVAYALWFIFDVFEILVVLYFLKKGETLQSVTRKYITCFTFVAGIGLVQYILQFFGIYFYVTQQNSMHRCNGFSYEPSYYATYLLMGWCICVYLLENSNYSAIPKRKLIIATTLISLALILSTSRMGWLMMVFYIFIRCFFIVFSQRGSTMSIWKFAMILFLIGGTAVLTYAVYGIVTGQPIVLKYVQGLGVGGTAAHSSEGRLIAMEEVWEVFKSSPFLGCSLGGVDPAICYNRGYLNFTNGSGMSVFVEMLAALGVIGFAFWLRYLYLFLYKKYKGIKSCLNKKDRELVCSYIIALIMEFIILQMNQNILRPSLWMHIAVMSGIYYFAEKKKKA